MEPLPQSVLRYMQAIDIHHHSPAFFKLTSSGILVDYGGDTERFGVVDPPLNTPAGEITCVLEGFFPLKAPEIILPCVETAPGVFADLHLFEEDKTIVWVLFLDKTEDEKKRRSLLQKSSELRLIEEKYRKLVHKKENLDVDILKRLHIAVFQQVDAHRFSVVSDPPSWFHELFGTCAALDEQGCFEPAKCFPFLEFFLAREAADLWKKKDKEMVTSNVWIESDSQQREYYFEAAALAMNAENILLVRRLDSQTCSSFFHIQTGREKSLAYEKSVKTARMLRSFLANMSHELRTPMNAILGISKMLGKYYSENLTAKQIEGLQLIYESGERLLNLINDLLDLSKIEAGKVEVIRKPVELMGLINGVVKIISPLLSDKEIEFYVKKDATIPFVIVTDEEKVRQILLNLLGNAVKFTQKGEIVLNLSLREGRLYFEVRDTGIGISEEHLHYIFDAFTQVNGSASRKYGGTGLGLALCKKLVTLLSGEISVRSRLDRGSVFTFYIPLETPQKQAAASTAAENRETGEKKQEVPEKTVSRNLPLVLIGEDEKLGRAIAEMILERHYRLVFAENGKEVVDTFLSIRPDIVLMDIMMPEMDGYKALDAIRSNPAGKHVPIIALTARAMQGEKEKILAHGFDGYITKPIDDVLLLQTMNKLLSTSSAAID